MTPANVIPLFAAYCRHCGKPIRKGQRVIEFAGPGGERWQLHPACMGGDEITPRPPPGGGGSAVAAAA